MKVFYSVMNENDNNSLYKIYMSFYSFIRGWSFYSAWETQMETGRQTAILTAPVLSVTVSWLWLRSLLTPTNSNSHRHLHISFHNAHDLQWIMWLFPPTYTGASLIDSSVNGQYATKSTLYEASKISPLRIEGMANADISLLLSCRLDWKILHTLYIYIYIYIYIFMQFYFFYWVVAILFWVWEY